MYSIAEVLHIAVILILLKKKKNETLKQHKGLKKKTSEVTLIYSGQPVQNRCENHAKIIYGELFLAIGLLKKRNKKIITLVAVLLLLTNF